MEFLTTRHRYPSFDIFFPTGALPSTNSTQLSINGAKKTLYSEDLVLAGPRRGVVQPCLHRKALIKIISHLIIGEHHLATVISDIGKHFPMLASKIQLPCEV
ncbi:hypothetical protein NC653_010261 [Populus alba x Populus x berolinensis]|uniref:Uncharacterized protein n=1 Tax=Populus alba x Populus x berolinensis TaxID=444605 RepID=A0AAD6W510_9ROSI|nr:hypothetical protein NC653_010261 [Populus alba x Populus x berolinensis]